MPSAKLIICLCIAGLSVTGCTSTIFKPFQIDGTSVSIDAKQRIVVSTKKGVGDDRNIVCAEPSPDALVAIAQAASAQANVIGQGSGALSVATNESAASIGIRTATIQLLRDALYRACEAYLNGAVNEFGYGLILNSMDDVMTALMGIEGLTQMKPAPLVAIGGSAKSAAEGSQTVTTEGEEDSTGESEQPSGEMEAESDTSAEAGSTTPVFSEATAVATIDTGIADAIKTMAQKDSPAEGIAGACMMWISSQKDLSASNYLHQQMLEMCKIIIEKLPSGT